MRLQYIYAVLIQKQGGITLHKILIIEDEAAIQSKGSREIGSNVIGDLIMERLGILDQVAYIRFASVYRHFEDLDEFMREINKLGEKAPDP